MIFEYKRGHFLIKLGNEISGYRSVNIWSFGEEGLKKIPKTLMSIMNDPKATFVVSCDGTST